MEKIETPPSSYRASRALAITGGILLLFGFFSTIILMVIRIILGFFLVFLVAIVAVALAPLGAICSDEPAEVDLSFLGPMLIVLISSFVLGGLLSPIIFIISSVLLLVYQGDPGSHRKGLIAVGIITLIFATFSFLWTTQTIFLELVLIAMTGGLVPFHLIIMVVSAIPVIGAIFAIIAGILTFYGR